MRATLLLALSFLLVSFEQSKAFAQQPTIVIKDVKDEYKNLDEIKSVLVNESDKSIYLLPEDCGEAQLWLYYLNKNWKLGVSKDCGFHNTSIEIKPGKSYQIPALVWRPLRTYDGKLIERKNFPGKYKIVMRYSLRPIVKDGKPQMRLRQDLMEVSEEFIIVQ